MTAVLRWAMGSWADAPASPITYIDSSTTVDSSGALSRNLNKPTMADGCVVVLIASGNFTGPALVTAFPTGFTFVRRVLDGTNTYFDIYYRVISSASAAAAETWTMTYDNTSKGVYHLLAFSGVDTTTPFEAENGAAEAGVSGPPTNHSTPSITTTSSGCVLISSFADRNTNSATYGAYTDYVVENDNTGATNAITQITQYSPPQAAGTYSRSVTAYGQAVGGFIAAVTWIGALKPASSTTDKTDSDTGSGTDASGPIAIAATETASGTDTFAVEEFADDFESGTTGKWVTVTGTPTVGSASAYAGTNGVRFSPANTAQRLATSTTGFSQNHRYAAIACRVRFNTLIGAGTAADVISFNNALQVNNLDIFVNGTGQWQADLVSTDSVNTGITVTTGTWYTIEAIVDYGSTSYTATIKIDGTNYGPITSTGQTASTARTILIGTQATTKTYQFDCDDVVVRVADSPLDFVGLTLGTLAKSDSETSTGTDAVSTQSAVLSSTETATGTDAVSANSTSRTATETAAGTDAVSASARATTTTETSSGTDATSSLSVTTSSTETGAGTDATLNKTFSTADTSTANDALSTLAVTTSSQDSANGTDAGSVDQGTTAKSGAETSSGTDAVSAVSASDSDPDAATATDAAVLIALSAAETSTATDVVSAKSITAGESGTGTDVAGTTAFSAAETSTATDVVTVSARATQTTETSTGTEGTPNVAFSAADTSTSAEASSSTVAFPGSDSGTATDAGAVAAAITASDTGTANDQSAGVGVPISASDTATGTEAVTARTTTTSSAETATGTDAGSPAVTTSASDTSSSTDAFSALATSRTTTETAAGTDAGAVTNNPSASDNGTATDSVSTVSATITGSETSSGSEVLFSRALTSADTATGTDALLTLNQGNSFTSTDTSTGTDVVSTLVASLTAADTAAASDNVSAKTMTGADTGSGSDTAGTVAPSAADTSTATDLPVAKTMTGAETSTGTDAVSNLNQGATQKSDSDTATSSEVSAVSALLSATDTSASTDVTTAKAPTAADSAAGVENTSIAATTSATEAGAAAEVVVSIVVPRSATDTAAGTDVATVAASGNSSDQATGTETIPALTKVAGQPDEIITGTEGVASMSKMDRSELVGSGEAALVTVAVFATDASTSVDAVKTQGVSTGDTVTGTDRSTNATRQDVETITVTEITSLQILVTDTKDIAVYVEIGAQPWSADIAASPWTVRIGSKPWACTVKDNDRWQVSTLSNWEASVLDTAGG